MAQLLQFVQAGFAAPPDDATPAGSGMWRRLPLPATGVAALCADPAAGGLAVVPCDPAAAARSGDVVALLVADASGGPVRHVCLALAPLYINADALPVAGLVVLRARDCLACVVGDGVRHVFYDTTASAEVAPYHGPAAVECPWCRQAVAPGQASVACPSCGVVCHQDEACPCWSAAPACPRCGAPTEAATASTWVPAGLRAGEAVGDAA